MPSDINIVHIGGRLAADPRVSQKACILRVASNRQTKVDGEWKEQAGYFDVVCFQDLAGKASVLRKGQSIFATGRLNQREYTDRSGTKQYGISVIADAIGVPLPDQHEQEAPTQQSEEEFLNSW